MLRKNYLEDGLLARRIADEEKKSRERIKKLEADAGDAYVKLLMAQEEKKPVDEQKRLQTELDQIQAKLEAEQKHAKSLFANGSVNLIQAGLGKAEEKKQDLTLEVAKPIRGFSPADMENINRHYKNLPEDLKKLMDAAIGEEISFELTREPVYVRGEGRVYDQSTINDMLSKTGEATGAYNRVKFQKKDVYPCNTLIKAMSLLLNIISGEEQVAKPLDDKLSSILEAETRKRVPAELIALIEKHYTTLIPRHKLLFDITCRDPMTKKIMDNPVFLPDGYVYDITTAEAYLRIMDGTCPSNPKIMFTKDDITPAHFVIAVLDQLKQNILDKIKEAKEAAAKLNAAAPAPGKKI